MAERADVMEAALDSFREGLALLGDGGRVVFWNRAAETITGFSRAEVVGQTTIPGLEPLLEKGDGNTGEGAARCRGVLIAAHTKCSFDLPVLVRRLVLRNGLGERIGEVVIFRRAEKIDALPGKEITPDSDDELLLADMKERAESAAEELRERGEPFGLFWITVDQARCLRRTHGAQACDELLKKLEHTLAARLRPSEVMGRWGEDGFLLVAREADAPALAARGDMLARMTRAVDFRWWGDRVPLSISVGVAPADPQEALAETLERARVAMAASVEAGGDRATLAPGERA